MARIPYSDMTGLKPDLKEELTKRPDANIYRMLANGGNAALGYLKMGSEIRFNAVLSPTSRELIILRTGSLCKSVYELDHHTIIARDLGLEELKINGVIHTGSKSETLDDFEKTLMLFTEETVIEGKASEKSFFDLAEYSSHEELIETTLLIGFYMLTSRFLQTFNVDLDEH